MTSIESFTARLEELKGEVLFSPRGELSKTLVNLAHQCAGPIAYYRDGLLDDEERLSSILAASTFQVFNIRKGGHEQLSRAEFKKKIATFELAFTPADHFLCDTGTLVFLQTNHWSRLLTLLPKWVVVVVNEASALSNLPALYERASDASSAPLLFTGPSRTADIEKKLVLGVHGPERLTVVIVSE